MEPAVQVFMDYAGVFEKTYVDDDWSRLEPWRMGGWAHRRDAR